MALIVRIFFNFECARFLLFYLVVLQYSCKPVPQFRKMILARGYRREDLVSYHFLQTVSSCWQMMKLWQHRPHKKNPIHTTMERMHQLWGWKGVGATQCKKKWDLYVLWWRGSWRLEWVNVPHARMATYIIQCIPYGRSRLKQCRRKRISGIRAFV